MTSPESATSPNSRKRSLPQDFATGNSTEHTLTEEEGLLTEGNLERQHDSNQTAEPLHNGSSNGRSDSPAPSTHHSTKGSIGDHQKAPHDAKPGKRRKVTFAEKEERRKERARREKEKTEQKARRDEEKRSKEEEKRQRDLQRDEEKRQKEEEREEKKRSRELENAKKEAERKKREEEKQRKEDEKEKKEKSQLRLNSFFPKPSVPSPVKFKEDPDTMTEVDDDATKPVAVAGASGSAQGDSSVITSKSAATDFERFFPPFFRQSHVTLAPWNRFHEQRKSLESVRSSIDLHLNGNSNFHTASPPIEGSSGPIALHNFFPTRPRDRRTRPYSTREIVTRLQGSANSPIDLTQSKAQPTLELLRSVPIKHLQFAEDFRPPYRGTFTRIPPENQIPGLRRNPFRRTLPETNYDYDSEAEWEEPDPEDGEDLGSEGDEDMGSEDDGAEMDDFLDDEDVGDGLAAPLPKRRAIVGDLEPKSSGLRWEDDAGKSQACDDDADGGMAALEGYRMEIIHDAMRSPIDPFSDSYWLKTRSAPPSGAEGGTITGLMNKKSGNMMDPPRAPLHAINRPNAAMHHQLSLVDSNGKPIQPTNSLAKIGHSSKSAKGVIDASEMEDFKQAVDGSDLTKTGLIEVLKKRFPKTPKDIIKNTLTATAARVGVKEADKRWALLEST